MKRLFKNPVIKFLSSLKLSAALMILVAFASAKATFIESAVGRDGAYDQVYAAGWFEGLLILVTISLILLFLKRWPYKRRQLGFALVHVAIVVILISSGITRYMGYEGIMPIREGKTADYIYSDKSHIQATFDGITASYPVRLWKYGENNIWNKVVLGGTEYELGVTEYWPGFAEVYQEAPGGPPGIKYGVTEQGEISSHVLLEDDKTTIAGVDARFTRDGFTDQMAVSRYGDIRLHVQGERCSFPVDPTSGATSSCAGYTFEILEFQSAFTVGGGSNLDGPMTNPMVKVGVTAPDGSKGEKVLFAYHPDFSMGHSGAEDDFPDLDILYQVNRGIEFTRGGDTGIQARASFPINTMDMNSQASRDIPAGEVFPLVEEMLYVNDDNGFSFVVVDLMESVVLAPSLSNDKNARPAARVVIRDDQGNFGETICLKQNPPTSVKVGDRTIALGYAPVVKKLPYSVTLDEFVLETYPGSQNPATYESYVTLNDPDQGIVDRKYHIYMNHPMTHRGSKHFQSSYDMDLGGTILSVNHDPGKWPTYFGYFLISLGFLMIILKEALFPTKKMASNSAADSVKTAAVLLAVLSLAALAPVSALAQEEDHTGHNHAPGEGHEQEEDHSGHNHAPGEGHNQPVSTGFVTFSDPAREEASVLIIQDYRGRMKPLDTLARESVMKVAKRSKHGGREPVDQFLSWSLNPQFWIDKPIIAVRFPGLKDLLGVDASVKHVSYESLFDAQGQYRYGNLVSEATRTPDRDRSKLQRKLITFHERFEILHMIFRGSFLKLYPIPGDENNTWGEIQAVTPRLNPEQADAYSMAFTNLAQGVRSGNNAQLLDGIHGTAAIQQQYGSQIFPSNAKIKAELLYNRSHIFSWMMIPLLFAFVVLMLVYLVNLFKNQGRKLSFKNPFYTLGVAAYTFAFCGMVFAYVLRWVASGRAPISNGHESLLFISIAVCLAGLIFELVTRMAVPASLGGLLTTVVLGVSMLSTFDPAIGPLVPVLVSYWLNIHVTIITSSYGFLGLGALIGVLTLFLLMAKGPNRDYLKEAVSQLDTLNKHLVVTGLGLLTIGTLLGGVWANESWGRYWGWDAKETWSLITILVYAVVLHFRWIPATRSMWLNAAGSLAAICSVVMTYFGVNYFLSGLHSYAQGDAAQVPSWVFIGVAIIITIITIAGLVDKNKTWKSEA